MSVTAEAAPAPGVERRYTARDASGGLVGRCESLTDGSQICTLAMPDGGLVVQQLQAEDGEFTPVAAPAVAGYGFSALLGAATGLYTYLQDSLRGVAPGGVAPDTPFLFFYRGIEGTEANARVAVGTLTQERVNEFCPMTAEFEGLLAQIANVTPSDGRSAQQWGMDVQLGVRDQLRGKYGRNSSIVQAEFSVLGGAQTSYGKPGSTRLDIYHQVEGTSAICAYDIKTGQAQLDAAQAARIYREAFQFGRRSGIANPQILVIELHRAP
ncbi:hypothetical protein [Sediminicoccus sp. KRV36]|uniref:hypothetical protein n=1 Tax=Sediminicoccus sp. KRV36 TaxID=3133721 RepID=UPI0020103B9A|nr:hypothetical protein [Sediminicoccus rosea]UPY38687.1 hypothetical protein LHU95_08315 [Sediminicoccus rosea]